MQDATKVKGFDILPTAWAKMFQAFLRNFYKSQGNEIIPIKVLPRQDKANGAYLRFEYTTGAKPEWLHVKNATTWY